MNMQQMVQAMQRTKREYEKDYAKLEAKSFTENANGAVEVTLKGDFTLENINVLDNDLLKPENKDELTQMIILAYTKCKEAIGKESDAISAKYSSPNGGMGF
ncbi:MAG: YbaB/EbfC family nucleoid-associated protein [Bacilli bacterium]